MAVAELHSPMVGPRNGAAAKTLIANPRCEAVNISAITPPAFVKGEEPKAPAKNRRMRSVWMFCDPAAPALNAVSMAYVPKKSTCRPYNSDIGAHSRGPIAKPRTKREIPRVATSSPIWNVVRIWSIPPLYAEETNATANVACATRG